VQTFQMKRRALCLAIASLGLAAAGQAAAQDYPSKPIRVLVPYPAGGVADKLARDISADLQKRLKQPVYVDNKPGGAGNIGFDSVARGPADGYTLLLAPASNLTVQTALFTKLSYDLEKDFAPVSVLLQTPQVLVVHPGLQVGSVKELVDYAKKHPGKVNFGISTGAFQHLTAEMLKAQAQADFEPVPYQGPAPALNDLVGGQIQFMFTEMMNALPLVAAGKLKALAVTSGARTPWMPQVPTMNELGYKDFEAATWYSIVVRSGTPKPVVDLLASELRAVVTAPDFKKRYEDVGAFTVGSTPAEMQEFVRKETVRWLAVVKRVGIQPN
jgi:tripartite-type tricarboxylate transporter receptor subunit TctC